jgi:hypothetical protein
VFFCGISSASAESDSAYWSEMSVEGPITERLSASVASKYRWNEDAKEHYYTATEIELNYEMSSWLDAGLGYKEVFKRKKNAWEQENRPYAQIAVKGKLHEWKIKNRVRAEHREKQGEAVHYRFRNKLTLKTPWKWTSLQINPFVADEVFIDTAQGEDFNENRFYAGVGMKLAERLWLDLSYLYNIETKNREWSERVNAIVTELAVKF